MSEISEKFGLPKNYAEGFVCKKCGHPEVEEVLTGVIQRSTVGHLGEDGEVDYDGTSTEEGSVLRYECVRCGFPIVGEDESIPTDGEGLRDALEYLAALPRCEADGCERPVKRAEGSIHCITCTELEPEA